MDRLSLSAIIDRRRPGSIYSTTVMRRNAGGAEKILMVSDDKSNVVTLDSVLVNGEYKTSVVPLDFPNIPRAAEIYSIHCVNRSREFDDFAIGLTYATCVRETEEDYEYDEICLNIYSGSPGTSLDIILQNCKTLKMEYLPYQLNYAIYGCDSHKEGIWLLSGSDKKIHAFKSNDLQISEQKIEDYFVEFLDTKDSIVLCFDIKAFCDYKKRVSFYGGETGKSIFAIVDSEKNQILHTVVERYRSPIISMQLFNIYNKTFEIEELESDAYVNLIQDNHSVDENQPVCILVGSVECAIVYMNVLEKHLEQPLTLVEKDRDQAVTASLIADINFDSKNEILLGTNENHVLSFEYKDNSWLEQQSLDLRHPVYTISYIDLNDEGVKDAIVMTKRGIHILKHEPDEIIELLMHRVGSL